MNRIIKFRGMNLEGRWFYGLPCIITVGRDRGSYISNSAGSPMAYDIRPETLTQFTGLLDKNGKEIYECMEIDNIYGVSFKSGCYILTNISSGDIIALYNYMENKNGQVEITREYTKI